MHVLRAAGYLALPDGAPNQYRKHLRVPDLFVGTYRIPVGGKDGQQPLKGHEHHQVTGVGEELPVVTPAGGCRE